MIIPYIIISVNNGARDGVAVGFHSNTENKHTDMAVNTLTLFKLITGKGGIYNVLSSTSGQILILSVRYHNIIRYSRAKLGSTFRNDKTKSAVYFTILH